MGRELIICLKHKKSGEYGTLTSFPASTDMYQYFNDIIGIPYIGNDDANDHSHFKKVTHDDLIKICNHIDENINHMNACIKDLKEIRSGDFEDIFNTLLEYRENLQNLCDAKKSIEGFICFTDFEYCDYDGIFIGTD